MACYASLPHRARHFARLLSIMIDLVVVEVPGSTL